MKNQSVQTTTITDVMLVCADGLAGIKQAITATFPKTDYQRCMLHMVRDTLKYVASNMKAFDADFEEEGNVHNVRIPSA